MAKLKLRTLWVLLRGNLDKAGILALVVGNIVQLLDVQLAPDELSALVTAVATVLAFAGRVIRAHYAD